ncbi:hypothetical protein B0H67DRAFT_7232 [Lasiosphaeris hirsuta]|uniref:Uncharacterized protein n=1 Tax=Lasiosphaeris hirsuta TaxID=260670 RepID=A0AA40B8T0_9PEZI|nr:hypothetical protein B0H67DRAFT_7232 [Lasiosphaeris hirsuta]
MRSINQNRQYSRGQAVDADTACACLLAMLSQLRMLAERGCAPAGLVVVLVGYTLVPCSLIGSMPKLTLPFIFLTCRRHEEIEGLNTQGAKPAPWFCVITRIRKTDLFHAPRGRRSCYSFEKDFGHHWRHERRGKQTGRQGQNVWLTAQPPSTMSPSHPRLGETWQPGPLGQSRSCAHASCHLVVGLMGSVLGNRAPKTFAASRLP